MVVNTFRFTIFFIMHFKRNVFKLRIYKVLIRGPMTVSDFCSQDLKTGREERDKNKGKTSDMLLQPSLKGLEPLL